MCVSCLAADFQYVFPGGFQHVFPVQTLGTPKNWNLLLKAINHLTCRDRDDGL